MLKNQKGITLVALVITVIVLLILAGTAITLALDGGGLFSHANNAATKWNDAVNLENNALTNLMTNANAYFQTYDPTV